MKDNTDHFVCRPRFLSNSLRRETCGNILLDPCIACEHCILGSNNLEISSARQNKENKTLTSVYASSFLRAVIIVLLLERTETLAILQLLVYVFYGIAEPKGSKYLSAIHALFIEYRLIWWTALKTLKNQFA